MQLPNRSWIVVCTFFNILLATASSVHANKSPLVFQDIKTIVQNRCLECHNSKEPQAGMDLERFQTKAMVMDNIETWTKVKRRISAGEMPPAYATPLTDEEKSALAAWIQKTMLEAACGDGIDPGPSPVRRLNRDEYAATIRDLLNIHFNAGNDLPDDGAGGAGFDNAAETLFISPVHAERYLDAAKEALDYAAKDIRARNHLFFVRPGASVPESQAARQVIERFASQAFRRPITLQELSRFLSLYRQASKRGEPFEPAVLYAMQAILISPHFLFLVEEPNSSDEIQPIGDYELASRLSYFLWGSMPDEELFALAESGRLHEKSVLLAQVSRMIDEQNSPDTKRRNSKELEDHKFYEFTNRFVNQWLGLRELGRDIRPDRTLFPKYNQELESAMKYEAVFLFQELFEKNLSLLNLIDSDFTFINRNMARLYGIQDALQLQNQQPVRVQLPKNSHRGGVMTMAGVLAVSSYPTRTSPVLRGKWVLETLLGTPPPPPPPNVPKLEENHKGAPPKTLRERLTQHRANPVCASCHDRIDPIGFSLENYDPIGRWRVIDANQPIDASGQLPDRKHIDGPDDLKDILMQRRDDVMRHLTEKMLGYALGRGLVLEDQCTVNQIVETLKSKNYRARILIEEIVKSIPFRYHQANEKPKPTPFVQVYD